MTTALNMVSNPPLGIGLVEVLTSVARSLIDGLLVPTEQRRLESIRRELTSFCAVLLPSVLDAEDRAGVEDALGEFLDDPTTFRAFLRFLQSVLDLAPAELSGHAPTREEMEFIFGDAPAVGRLLMLERTRARVLSQYPQDLRPSKELVERAEPPLEGPTTGILESLSDPRLSPMVVRVRYEMLIGDVAAVAAACLVASRREGTKGRVEDLREIYEQGLYAWLRWHTAFFPNEIPLSLVPAPDRFDEQAEDNRAAARESALRMASATSIQTGMATHVFPEQSDGHGSGPRPG